MLKTINEKIAEINEERVKLAKEYFQVRVERVTAYNYTRKSLIERLAKYRRNKPNIGVDMAFLWREEEANAEKDSDYLKMADDARVLEAKYKGMDRLLDALEGQSISLQSAMKHMVHTEQFTSYEGDGA